MADLLVLCYHAISDRWPAMLATPAAQMRAQLEFLLDRGYRGGTLTEAIASRGRSKTLVVTFDDAFRSVLDRGKPILDELGVPATMFVPTAFPDRQPLLRWEGIDRWLGGEHEPELVPLAWSEIGGLRADGWEIGSHTVSHPHLTHLDDSELGRELAESRAECERALGAPCRSLAYPYGDHDARVVAATADAGYDVAVTLTPGRRGSSPHAWPRLGVYRPDAGRRFQLKVVPFARAVRAGPAWRLVRGIGRAAGWAR